MRAASSQIFIFTVVSGSKNVINLCFFKECFVIIHECQSVIIIEMILCFDFMIVLGITDTVKIFFWIALAICLFDAKGMSSSAFLNKIVFCTLDIDCYEIVLKLEYERTRKNSGMMYLTEKYCREDPKNCSNVYSNSLISVPKNWCRKLFYFAGRAPWFWRIRLHLLLMIIAFQWLLIFC